MGPEFVPTSQGPGWRGKVKCVWCGQAGWPLADGGEAWSKFWGLKHGVACKKRESVRDG